MSRSSRGDGLELDVAQRTGCARRTAIVLGPPHAASRNGERHRHRVRVTATTRVARTWPSQVSVRTAASGPSWSACCRPPRSARASRRPAVRARGPRHASSPAGGRSRGWSPERRAPAAARDARPARAPVSDRPSPTSSVTRPSRNASCASTRSRRHQLLGPRDTQQPHRPDGAAPAGRIRAPPRETGTRRSARRSGSRSPAPARVPADAVAGDRAQRRLAQGGDPLGEIPRPLVVGMISSGS